MEGRIAGSHVRHDGTAKRSFERREEAVAVANLRWQITGNPHDVYRCTQRPEHWHIGHGVADLKAREA